MLLVSTVLMILFLSLPVDGIRALDILPMFIVGVLSALFSLLAIFMYKQLDLQKRVTLLGALFACVSLVAAAIVGHWTIFLYVVPAFLLDIWAYLRIKVDQNLLKSYDRLR